MEDINIKLSGILALAERGSTEGERNSARKTLLRLMQKHNISMESLSDDTKKNYDFKYNTAHEKSLLMQIVAMTLNSSSLKYMRPRGSRVAGFELTEAQFVEISYLYELYLAEFRRQLKKETDTLLKAFIHRNRIFIKDREKRNVETLSKDEIEDLLRALRRAKELDPVQIRKAIETEKGS